MLRRKKLLEAGRLLHEEIELRFRQGCDRRPRLREQVGTCTFEFRARQAPKTFTRYTLRFVWQYRHNLKSHQFGSPRRTLNEHEEPGTTALRELEEETGFTLMADARILPLGTYYSLPETNKYTHVFLASPVIATEEALLGVGTTITSMETVGGFMAARSAI